MMRLGTGLLFVLVLFILTGCCEEPESPIDEVDTTEIRLDYPAHFPAPDIPADNPLTQAKVNLGRKLFFDPILSADSTVSCGSCHFQDNAFSDPSPFSTGVGGVIGSEAHLRRNAPPLFNLAWHVNLFWDGAIEDDRGTYDILENQVRVPIEAPHEMAADFLVVLDRLNANADYTQMFYHAFGDTATELRVMQALASFERTLISGGSKYDQFIASGFEDSTLFTESEWRGYKLYFAETGERHAECFHCHGGINFDEPSGEFRHNGLFDIEAYEDDPGRALLASSGPEYQANYGKFKVPSLRNIEFTAPYMHDGSFPTLDSVINRYVEVSQFSPFDLPPNTDILIQNIAMTEADKADLIAFLKTLSDPDFLTNPDFQPE